MSGLSANIINLITDNLRDRYQSGFPIIKELIQNADDAGASRLVFGEHSGFQIARHRLLNGRALFFFNDGRFKSSDAKAIASFAENTKAGEADTIGKFGLGMKSIFHLCEAFFHIAFDDQGIRHDVLNPWNTNDGNLHPDWEDVDGDDWDRIRSVTKDYVNDSRTWFLLWIPLRQRQHLQDVNGHPTGSIIDRFPGDNDRQDLEFLDEFLQTRLAGLLPLLPHLSLIEYEGLNGSHGFSISLNADQRLERLVEKTESTGVVLQARDGAPLLSFYGRKRQYNYECAANLWIAKFVLKSQAVSACFLIGLIA